MLTTEEECVEIPEVPQMHKEGRCHNFLKNKRNFGLGEAKTKIMKIKHITEHYAQNWGRNFFERRLMDGPMQYTNTDFVVLEFPPQQNRKCWTYATVGMSSFTPNEQIELHLFSPDQDQAIVELLTATAYYQFQSPDKIKLWHTVNFGRSWKENSSCQYGFISLPYLDGPKLEKLVFEGQEINFFWLIPITAAEKRYKQEMGVEALEVLFEKNNFNYMDPQRTSVV